MTWGNAGVGRIVFESLDRDADGEVSVVELEFGLKTINKQLISRQELEYVTVVLEVTHAHAITFRCGFWELQVVGSRRRP